MTIDLVPAGDGPDADTNADSPVQWKVDIRVLDVNDWPELQLSGSPTFTNVQPGIEYRIFDPAVPARRLELSDEDNDEIIDSPDGSHVDGPGEDMLLIGLLECNDPLFQASDFDNLGFRFGSSTFTRVADSVQALLEDVFDPTTNPLNSQVVAGITAALGEVDGYADQQLVTSSPVSYTDGFAGIGTIQAVQDALSDIRFRSLQEGDTCNLLIIVSDLGNNGLPLQYLGSRPNGIEVPFPGVDWQDLTISTGDLIEIDVSFDEEPLYVMEGEDAIADLAISVESGPPHPGFPLLWSTIPTGATPSPDGDADFNALTDMGLTVPPGSSLETIDTFVRSDTLDEGNETFDFSITVPTAPPPGAFTRPDGYEIVSERPTRQVVIIDDDDPAKVITSVSDASVVEGPLGVAPDLQFTINLSGPADGNETVRVTTTSAAPDTANPANDYTPLVNQLVTFAPGALSATVNVVVAGDYEIEGDETLTLTLSSPTNTSFGASVQPGSGTITNDDNPPTVAIAKAAGPPAQADPTNVAPVVFDVTFSVPMTDFDDDGASPGDVVLGGTAGATTFAIAPKGSSTQNYTVSVTGMTQSGTITATIPAAVAEDDPGGRANVAAPSAATVQWDVTGPTVTIVQGATQVDPTSLAPVVFDVVFSESVTNFVAADVTMTAPPGAVKSISGSGANYTVNVSGMTASGLIIVDIPAGVATDSVGNPNTAAGVGDKQVQFNFPVGDTTKPTVVIAQSAGQADPTLTSPVSFTATFSEPVVGFGAAGVVLTTTTGAILTPTVSPTANPAIYNVSVAITGTPTDGTITAAVAAGAAKDSANNDSEPSTFMPPVPAADDTVTFGVRPTVTIDQKAGQPDPTSATPVLFTATFSEPVVGFATGDVTLANGTGGSLVATVIPTGDPLAYDVSVAVAGATMTGDITASIAAGVATDVATNSNVASTSTDSTVQWVFVPQNNPDPLVLTVPGNIVKDADPNQNGAIVTYPAPTTTGGVLPVVISCSHQSGDFYPIGLTTVSCMATDSEQSSPDEAPFSGRTALAEPGRLVVAALTVGGTFTITVNQPATTTTNTQPAGPTTTLPGGGPPSTTIPGSGATLPPELFPPGGQPGITPSGFPSAGPTAGLPETGSNVADTLMVAAMVLTLGGFLLVIRRRADRPSGSAPH